MKVLAFNGSPRKGGNTEYLLREAMKPMEAAGIETEVIQLGSKPLQGCTGCRTCAERKNQRCIFEDDPVNDWVQKMIKADGILLGSPTYYADITSNTKAFIDRVGYIIRQNGDLMRRKVGAGVLAVRRGGSIHAFDSINHFFSGQPDDRARFHLLESGYWQRKGRSGQRCRRHGDHAGAGRKHDLAYAKKSGTDPKYNNHHKKTPLLWERRLCLEWLIPAGYMPPRLTWQSPQSSVRNRPRFDEAVH